jgi:hypothetical protein
MQPNPNTFICFKCKYRRPYSGGCNAFPKDIPNEIIFKNKHNKPIKGQKNNIVFEEGESLEEQKMNSLI